MRGVRASVLPADPPFPSLPARPPGTGWTAWTRCFAGSDGAPLYPTGATTDIPERLEAERAVQESEAKLRRLTESGMIGVFYWTTAGTVTEANAAFCRMLGWSPDEVRAGAGLGLAIAKGIVAAHGGRIHVESTVGAGTAFRFTVPASTPGARGGAGPGRSPSSPHRPRPHTAAMRRGATTRQPSTRLSDVRVR